MQAQPAQITASNVRVRKTKVGPKPYLATLYGYGSFGTGITREDAIDCCLRRAKNERRSSARRLAGTR